MVGQIIRYIERVAPSLIVMENVIGLLSFGRDVFLKLVQRLQAADYSIAMKVLRSEMHGGCPSAGAGSPLWLSGRRPLPWGGREAFRCAACRRFWQEMFARRVHGRVRQRPPVR